MNPNMVPIHKAEYSICLHLLSLCRMAIHFRSSYLETRALSNFFEFPFVLRGLHFSSTEASYQWEKAIHHDDACTSKIMREVTRGCDAKRGSIQDHDILPSWHDVKKDLMEHIILEKFYQCPPFRHLLIPGVEYIEDTTDLFWGRGTYAMPGKNVLGHIIARLAISGIQILVAGSSHAREMDQYLEPILRENLAQSDPTRPVCVDSMCIPGASIDKLRKKLLVTPLQQYRAVIILAGGCSLYDKHAKRIAAPSAVAKELEELQQELQRRTSGPVLLSSLLLKVIPETMSQMEAASKYSLNYSTVKSFNNAAAYVNRKIDCVRFPDVSTCYGSVRQGYASLYDEDCLHLLPEGKRKVCLAWYQELRKLSIL